MKTFEMPKAEIIALDVVDIVTASDQPFDDEWGSIGDRVWG